MDLEYAIDFLDTISIIVIIGIIVVYGLASYWNIKFLMITKKQSYTWIKIYTTIMCIVFVMLYLYFITMIILGKPIESSLFAAGFARPAIFLMGGALASSARARYTSLLSGGEDWKMRKMC
jgi:hypothetical protein